MGLNITNSWEKYGGIFNGSAWEKITGMIDPSREVNYVLLKMARWDRKKAEPAFGQRTVIRTLQAGLSSGGYWTGAIDGYMFHDFFGDYWLDSFLLLEDDDERLQPRRGADEG